MKKLEQVTKTSKKLILIMLSIITPYVCLGQHGVFVDFGLKYKVGISSNSPFEFKNTVYNGSEYFKYSAKTFSTRRSLVPIGSISVGYHLKNSNSFFALSLESDNASTAQIIENYTFNNGVYLNNFSKSWSNVNFWKAGVSVGKNFTSKKDNSFRIQLDYNFIFPEQSAPNPVSGFFTTIDNTKVRITRTGYGSVSGSSLQIGFFYDLKTRRKYLFTLGAQYEKGFKNLLNLRTELEVETSIDQKTYRYNNYTKGSGFLFSISRKIYWADLKKQDTKK